MKDRVVNRSDFFREGFRALLGYASEVLSSAVDGIHGEEGDGFALVLRPPGAIDESSFLARCTRCDACIDACPHNAIVHATEEDPTEEGTPLIHPAETPCWMCDDLPCVEACADGALIRTDDWKIGTAHIRLSRCLAYSAQLCDFCFTHCPLKGTAIQMEARKPHVVEDECTGCGVCEYICPVPGKAIEVIPTNAS